MESHETFLEPVTDLSGEVLIERVLELEAQLAEAQAQITELRRQLFGPKAEKLSPDEQAQMDTLTNDLREEAQQPPPLSQEAAEGRTSGSASAATGASSRAPSVRAGVRVHHLRRFDMQRCV